MKNCPVCGKEIPNVNKYCSIKCYKEFIGEIPEITENLRLGGDKE